MRTQAGWCSNSRTLEEQQASPGEAFKGSAQQYLEVTPLLKIQESLQRALPNPDPASYTSYLTVFVNSNLL